MKSRIKKYTLIIFCIWTVLTILSLLWNYTSQQKDSVEIAKMLALNSIQKDMVYQQWASNQGEVYVPETESTQANAYLEDNPERDIRTPSGRELALISPANMIREVNKLGLSLYGYGGHICSLDPIHAPDIWEKEAIDAFQDGETEGVVSITELNGEKVIRLMTPMMPSEGCLKCHSSQDYEAGMLKGGISTIFPYSIIQDYMRPRLKNIYFGHLFIWLLGGVLHLSFSLRFSHIEKLQESSAKQLADFQKSQLEDSERSRLAMLGILEDLKNSEKNNRLIAERFALATQAADLGVYDYNLVSNEIIWDSTMYEIYGLDKETFTLDFDSWVSRVHPDDRSRVVPEFKDILQSDGQFNTEFRIIKPDGTIAFIHAVAEFHEGRSGNPERVVGINWDVTEMRIAEQQYSQIIKTSNDGFWIMGTDGSLLEVNEAYCQMVGYSREELLSMNARDMETEPGKFESVVKDIQQHGHLRYETKHSCKGGAVIDVQLNCQLDQNLNGRIFTFVQDISLRTKADLEVQKNLKELQRWYNVTLKREVRVKELKNEVNSLLVKAGLERKYTTISNSE